MDIDSNNEDKSALEKSLAKMKNEAANLRKVINSGNIEGLALKQASNEFNSISEKIETLEAKIDNYTQLKKYRILTYDYCKVTLSLRKFNR